MKIVSTGCSFSDYTGCSVTKTYGEIFAEKLGCEYLHLARGGCGNERIFRQVVDGIQKGSIVEGDLIIIQLTEITRREVPFFLLEKDYHNTTNKNSTDNYLIDMKVDSDFGGYTVFNWKPDIADDLSYIDDFWPQFISHKKYLFNYTEGLEAASAYNEPYILHRLQINNTMLQALCEKHGVKLLYFWHTTLGWIHDKIPELISEKYVNTMYDFCNAFEMTIDHALGWDIVDGIKHQTEFDGAHFGQKGHNDVGNHLYEHYLKIKELL